MGYRKILVAFTMHDKNMFLFEEALDLAKTMDAELLLFCCFEEGTVAEEEDRVTTIAELDMSDSQRIHDKHRVEELGHVRAWLESLARIAREHGISAHADAEEGKPARRICDAAAHWGSDLIVLGHSSGHRLRELLLGSTYSHVIRDAHCAVLVTRAQ